MSQCEAPSTVADLLGEAPVPQRAQKKAAEANAFKLVPKLIEACRWSRSETIEELSKEIAASVRNTHPAVAERISKLFPEGARPIKLMPRPEHLLDLRVPRHKLEAVVLPDSVARECHAIVAEHHRMDELARFKLAARHKVLLYGPPGNGKTLLAEALAAELNLPYLPVKYSGLIEGTLGSTGKNLQKIFDYAQSAPCVVFVDEIDAVALNRSHGGDVGEIRRITNQLLILLEQLPPFCVFVGATNAEAQMDRAVIRRFDFAVELPAPTAEVRLRCAERELATEHTPGHDVTHLAAEVAELPLENLSSLVLFCQRIRRDLALNDGVGIAALLHTARASEEL